MTLLSRNVNYFMWGAMPPEKDYYEILGVPRTATTEQIKRRYRQLARKYHPDVAEDKGAAKAAFVQISEAYRTLINPDKRVIYDSMLDARRFRVETRPRPSAQTPPRSAARAAYSVDVRRLVNDAELAFVRGRFRSAASACREAIRLDRRNVRAHIILGDVYRAQGRVDEALSMYTIALQLDPTNAEAKTKFDKLARRGGSGQVAAIIEEKRRILRMGFNLVGGSTGTFIFFLLAVSQDRPIAWLAQNLPFVGTWSAMLIVSLLVGGVLIGLLLSVNELVRPFDDELVFQMVASPGRRGAIYPIGLILVVFNLLCFYAAGLVYVIVGVIQESLSKSVMAAFAAAFALVLLAATVYSPGRGQVFLFGGNIVFPAVLLGWVIGDMFRSGW